jgi:RNA polymerase sigma-70 factor (ECF subfamily)
MPQIDPDALAKHLNRLYRAAWALCGSREEAEDLVQETFVKVLSRRRRIRNEDELPYLLASLRNTFLDSRRRAARRPRTVGELEQLELADPQRRDDPAESLRTRELFTAIAELPLDFRLALVAVDVAGLSHREAAELLDTREATIATRLFRARARVARTLQGEDAEGPEAAGREKGAVEAASEQRTREDNDVDTRLIEERRR